jgi:hypothetical protein
MDASVFSLPSNLVLIGRGMKKGIYPIGVTVSSRYRQQRMKDRLEPSSAQDAECTTRRALFARRHDLLEL